MEASPQRCWNCQADTTLDHAAGLTYCAACGRGLAKPCDVTNEPHLDADDLADRQRWRLCFWLIILINPVATIVVGISLAFFLKHTPRNASTAGVLALLELVPLGILGVFVLGCLAGGYCLMKLNGVPAARSAAVVRVIWNATLIFFATSLGILLLSALL